MNTGVSVIKNPPAVQKTWVPSLGQEYSPGEENGYPLQYSCLGNPLDRRAWQAAVHGITKSWIQLSDWHFSLSWDLSQYTATNNCRLGYTESSTNVCWIKGQWTQSNKNKGPGDIYITNVVFLPNTFKQNLTIRKQSDEFRFKLTPQENWAGVFKNVSVTKDKM